ncbi:MAG: Autotransporter-associated beta strand repeat protein, partial [Verrucomicrobiaceae bacterium]|nr:Autotransporter-associated beta strand repeat protein [Verrucomicrobiaceae bacterium]
MWTVRIEGATLTWDSDGTLGVPTGGTGVWDTASNSWDGGTIQPWTNGSNLAQFGGTPGTVTLGAPITAGGLIFNAGGYTLAGTGANPLTLVGPASIQVNGATTAATISAILAGSAGLVKAGTGDLLLTGANTFTGGTSVTAGRIGVGGAFTGATGTALGAGTLTVTNGGIFATNVGGLSVGNAVIITGNSAFNISGVNSITLASDVTGATTAANQSWTLNNTITAPGLLTISGNLVNSDTNDNSTATWVIGGSGSTTISGAILANGTGGTNRLTALTINSGGTVTLSGGSANTFKGNTTLTQGTLVLAKVGALGTVGNFNFNGGTLQTTVIGGLVNANALVNPVVLGGANSAVVAGSQSITFAGGLTNSGGNRLLVNNLSGGASLTIAGINLSNDATNRLFTLAGTGNTLVSGVIANGGTATASQFINNNSGTLTLTADNTYVGTTVLNAGNTVLTGANGRLGSTASITINPSARLTLDNSTGDSSIFTRTDSRPMIINGGTLAFIGKSAGTTEVAGPLTLNSGGSVISMNSTSGNTLNFTSLTFTAGSSLNVVAANLGNTNMLTFNTVPALTPASTGVYPRMTVNGSDFASYTNSIVPFSSYVTDLSLANLTDTVKVVSSTPLSVLLATRNAMAINGSGVVISGTPGANLSLTSGALLNTGGSNQLSIATLSLGTVEGIIHTNGVGNVLDITGSLTGTAGVTKTLDGTLQYSAPQYYTGTTTVNGGSLKLNGGLNAIFQNQPLALNGGMIDLNGQTQYVGTLSTGNATVVPGTGGSISSTSNTGTLVTNMAASAAFTGGISGTSVNFVRSGGNTLTFESPMTNGGIVLLNGGTTILRDNAAFLNASAVNLNYATLLLDNNAGLQTDVTDRMGNGTDVNLRGGVLTVAGRAGTASRETFGNLNVMEGAGTVSLSVGGGAVSSEDISFNLLNRTAGSTLNFTSTAVLGATGNNTRVQFTSAPTTILGGLLGAWAVTNSGDYAAFTPAVGVGDAGGTGFRAYDTVLGSGMVTNLTAAANLTTTLSLPQTLAAMLRLNGNFANDIAFNSATNILNLENGGLLRSNSNASSSIGSPQVPGILTAGGMGSSGVNELVVYTNQNVITINSIIKDPKQTTSATILNGNGTLSLVKSGAGTLVLTGANTYTKGTVVNQGTLIVNGMGSTVVIPAGGITLNSGTLIMGAAQGQIGATNTVTLNGSSTLTMAGDNTLFALNFNNNGGITNPLVTTGGTLILSSAAPISVASSNVATTPTINGVLDFGTAAKTLNIGAIGLDAATPFSNLTPSINIAATIIGSTASLIKAGTGVLQLGGQNTFGGGVTVSNGGLLLASSSSPLIGGGVGSGPVGTGTLTMSNTGFLVATGNQSIANSVTLGNTSAFYNLTNAAASLSLNGAVTLSAGANVVSVNHPLLTVNLGGQINGGAVTSLTKNGLGNLSVGPGYSGPITFNGGGALGLLADGDGTGHLETINYPGAITFNTFPTFTVGRASASTLYTQAANKLIDPINLVSSISDGLTVNNLNGYGLSISSNQTLNANSTFTVNNATNGDVTQGLYLTGVISGQGFVKAGAGTLVLTNPANSFSGTLDVRAGLVSVSDPGALGDPGNVIQLYSAGGLRVTENMTLGNASLSAGPTLKFAVGNNALIQVSTGKRLTIEQPIDGSVANNNILKGDNGLLVFAADQATWSGNITINAGTVRGADINSAGSLINSLGINGTITVANNVGAAFQILAGQNINKPFAANNTGINNAGALQAIGGASTYSGIINLGSAATIGANLGSTLTLLGGVAGGQALTFTGTGNIVFPSAGAALGAVASVTKISSGTLRIENDSSLFTGALTVNAGTVVIGSGLNGGSGTGRVGGTTTSALTLNNGGVLTVDDTGSISINNRLGGNRPVTLQGGTLNFVGGTAGTSLETFGAVTIQRGQSTISVTASGSQQANIILGAPTIGSTGGTVLFRGTNLGQAAGIGRATIASTTTGFAFINQLGATGTANKGVIPWALVDPSETGLGTSFATGDAAVNVATTTAILRPLSASEMTIGSLTANNNIQLATTVGTGTVSINTLTLQSGGGVTINAASGTSVPALTIPGAGILALQGNTGISGGLFNLPSTTQAQYIHTVGNTTNLNITSTLFGGPGQTNTGMSWVKAGTGTLTLSPPATAIPGVPANLSTGLFVINQGTVALGGGNNSIQFNNFMELGFGGTLNLNGFAQYVTELFADGTVANSGGTVTGPSGAGVRNTIVLNRDNSARNFAGVITGNVGLNRGGLNNWTLFSNNDFTGPVALNGGLTILRDLGAFSGTSRLDINYGATLQLDNSQSNSTTGATDRLNDTKAVNINGGSLSLFGRPQALTRENVGDLTLTQGGAGTITVNASVNAIPGGSVYAADLVFTGLVQSPGSTINLIGQTNSAAATLGQLGSNPRVSFQNAPTLVNNILGGWAIVNGSEFASYDPTETSPGGPAYGIGALNAPGFPGYDGGVFPAASAPAQNIRLGAASTISAGGLVINSLNVAGAFDAAFGNASATLNLGAGGLLKTGNTSNLGSVALPGQLTAGSSATSGVKQLVVYSGTAGQALTINSKIINNGLGATLALVTSGPGTVTLNALSSNTYSGGTFINQGVTIAHATAGATVIPAGGLAVNGGTLTMSGATGGIDPSNVLTLNGPGIVNLVGPTTFSSVVINNNGGGNVNPVINTSNGTISPVTGTTPGAGIVGGGSLVLGTGGLTVNSSNVGSTATITGRIDLGSVQRPFAINSIQFNDQEVALMQSSLIVTAAISGTAGFNKTGNGAITLSAQNPYTGPTNVTAGQILIGAAGAGSRFSQFNLSSGATLNLNGNSALIGSLAGVGLVTNSSLTTAATLSVGFDNSNFTVGSQFKRFTNAIINNLNVTKVGTGSMTMNGVSDVTGAFAVNQGTVTYSGAGAGIFAATTVLTGGTLVLDNSSTNVNNRLGGSTSVGTLTMSGGTARVIGNASAGTTESIGTFSLATGNSILNLEANAAQGTTFAVGTLGGATAGSTLLLRGSNLGAAAGAGVANFTAATANLIGGGGGAATTTMSIRPDILGDVSLTGLGAGFVTVGTAGFRTLATNEYATVLNAGGTANILLTGPGGFGTFGVSTTVSSLTLGAGSGTLSTGNLPIANIITLGTAVNNAGGILALPGNTGMHGGQITTGSGSLFIHTSGDLDIDSVIISSGSVTKSEAATLTFSQPQIFTGTLFVNNGTVKLNGGDNTLFVDALGNGRTLQMNAGTLDLNGNDQLISALNNSNSLSGTGGVVTNTAGGAPAIFTLTGSTSAGGFGGSLAGNLTFEKTGTGAIQLNSVNSYIGETIIRGGTLSLRDNGTLFNGTLGTSAIRINFGTLNIDNSGFYDRSDRVSSTAPIFLQGGTLTLTAGTGYDSTQTVGPVTLVSNGASTLNANTTNVAGGSSSLTVTSLTRNPNAVLNFVGNALGFAMNAGNGRILFTNAPALTNNLIGGWAVVGGTEFATYGANGVAALNQAGYPGYDASLLPVSSQASQNIRLLTNGNIPSYTGSAETYLLNSLNIPANANITFTDSTDILNLVSGGLLKSTANNNSIGATADSGRIAAGGTGTGLKELFITNAVNTLTVNSRVVDNGF